MEMRIEALKAVYAGIVTVGIASKAEHSAGGDERN
jgi:hypothetical protein